jgi:hypothetical protein
MWIGIDRRPSGQREGTSSEGQAADRGRAPPAALPFAPAQGSPRYAAASPAVTITPPPPAVPPASPSPRQPKRRRTVQGRGLLPPQLVRLPQRRHLPLELLHHVLALLLGQVGAAEGCGANVRVRV